MNSLIICSTTSFCCFLAHYLDTVAVMLDGLTKNVAAAMTAHTEPMANLTAQLKRVAAELP
jgi:hypothetical protein